jgi:multicomponent Na+:H+ antiporter subunit F
MNVIYLSAAIILLMTVGAGMVRILRGPTTGDRMLTAQLFGTTGVTILLLLSFATSEAALIDVALVFALLAAVATVAFVRQRELPDDRTEEADD